MKAIKEFFDNMDLLDFFFFIICIVSLIISVIGIYHLVNPPDTIKRNGYVYELQHDPAYSIVEYNCTYVLKDTDE